MINCDCCVAVTSQILATRPSGRRWTGATNSSPTGSVSCLPGCRSSRGASTWKPPRRCVPGAASFPARSSTRSRAWWISRCWRWSAGQVPRASGCLISSASTPPSGLAAAGQGVPLADRHRAYFRELAERADRELWALVPAGRARLDDESPNLRAAIDDGCARAPDDALAMVGALGLYWRVRGRLAEGVTATEQSLACRPARAFAWTGSRPGQAVGSVVLAWRFCPHAVHGHLGSGDGRGDWRYPLAGTRAQPARGSGHIG